MEFVKTHLSILVDILEANNQEALENALEEYENQVLNFGQIRKNDNKRKLLVDCLLTYLKYSTNH